MKGILKFNSLTSFKANKDKLFHKNLFGLRGNKKSPKLFLLFILVSLTFKVLQTQKSCRPKQADRRAGYVTTTVRKTF